MWMYSTVWWWWCCVIMCDADWLAPVARDRRKAACNYCSCILRAHYSDLCQHSKCAKHLRNAKASEKGACLLHIQRTLLQSVNTINCWCELSHWLQASSVTSILSFDFVFIAFNEIQRVHACNQVLNVSNFVTKNCVMTAVMYCLWRSIVYWLHLYGCMGLQPRWVWIVKKLELAF